MLHLLVSTQWLNKSLTQVVKHSFPQFLEDFLEEMHIFPRDNSNTNQERKQLIHNSILNVAQEELWLSGRVSVLYTEDPRLNP